VREELDRILDSFAIQLDNPIAILNQDAAKTFLFKCDPSKLYEFFMRATQLEDCRRDYNTAAEEKNTSDASIQEKVATLPDIKKEVHIWEKKYQFHQTLENKKEAITTLKTELAWSMAKQAEAEYSKASKEMT
jgi:DNA repair ATPase RecN